MNMYLRFIAPIRAETVHFVVYLNNAIVFSPYKTCFSYELPVESYFDCI